MTAVQALNLDEGAVELIDHGTRSPLLLVCEHASHVVPDGYANLGLSDLQLQDHIGWDIGAARVTRLLAAHFGATALLARYSRLFLDCNRDPKRADAIAEVSDGVLVPGNQALSRDEREKRVAMAFRPLHEGVSALIDRHRADGSEPLLVSVHSFTPVMNGARRPWGIGVLWNECDALGDAMTEALRVEQHGDNALIIGANEPYSAKAFITYTLENHGRLRGIANMAIEIRNDLIRDEKGGQLVADLLARSLARIASV